MKPSRSVASFDSASGMLRALGRFLHGRDVPLLGQFPAPAEPLVSSVLGGVNRLPRPVVEKLYAVSGWAEAVPASRVGQVRAGALAQWVVEHYPRRQYPAVFVGSSNGAAMHLAAALGVPWLPQTLLVPVRRRGVHPDEPADDLRAMRGTGEQLLTANPDLALHHMHDANQDRLMIAGMTYFRVKWRVLPEAYRRFLHDHLAPGGTVYLLDCGLRWPTTTVTDRYVFQHGALGGATVEEFQHGSERVAAYLAAYGSHRRAWQPPPTDGTSPEAEWGFDHALEPDLQGAAAAGAARLSRLSFAEPEDLSPLVAELYRQWYARRGLPTDRLLVESFLLLDPWWTLRTGSVPFWMVFNKEPSLQRLHAYLDSTRPYAEIRLTLFSHGVDSVGLPPVSAWEAAARRGRKVGTLLGVDRAAFPRDFASLARFHRELSQVRDLAPLPRPLRPAEFDAFLEQHGAAFAVDGYC